MIEFNTSLSFSQVPYATDEAIDQYAEAVVRDAMPEVLREPTVLDAERFMEHYLGLHVDVKRFGYDRKVLAMTAFKNGAVQVVDETDGKTIPFVVREGTVIIDTSLTGDKNAEKRRFSLMHEGAHWLIHRPAFEEDKPLGISGTPGVFENKYLAAKEGRVDYSRSNKARNDNERIERQADFLASALLMPKPTMRMAYREFFRFSKEHTRQIVRSQSKEDDEMAETLPKYIAGRFGVSKRAALIRLEKLNAIVGKPHCELVWTNADSFEPTVDYGDSDYVYVVHRPKVAYRRADRRELYNRRIIKCPYCRERLTDVDASTKVELFRLPSQKPLSVQQYSKCPNCKGKVGLIFA